MTARRFASGALLGLFLIPFVTALNGCKREESTTSTAPAPTVEGKTPAGAPTIQAVAAGELALPEMDLTKLPLALQAKFGDARYQARRAPNDALKVGELGALCYVHGFPQAAVACFKRATELVPGEYGWWYYLGRASEQAKDTAQAKAAYEKTLAINKDYEPAQRRLALLAGDAKKPAEASTQPVRDPLEEALLIQGCDLRMLLSIVFGLAEHGQFAQAEEVLKRARDVDESGVQTRMASAQIFVLQGKLDDAVREFERLLATPEGKKVVQVRIGFARVQLLRRDLAAAEQRAREALELDAESFDAANILAWLLATNPDASHRNGEEAVKWAEKACELTKYGNHAFLDTLAAAYATAGRYEDAQKQIAAAIKLADEQKQAADVETYRSRQKLYEAGKPYVEGQ